jgi:hypothetical protein
MASFQIVYDDFSGGQYMGPKATNLPKNTFQGENVLPTTHGEVIPTGVYPLGYADAPVNVDYAQIRDLWQVSQTAYAFVHWSASGTNYSRMVTNSTTSVTSTYDYATGGIISGRVAFDSTSNSFYYVSGTSLGAATIRNITISGTDTAVSSGVFTSGTWLTEIALYGYRLVCWGSLSNRLYYSNTDKTTFSLSQYYEFNGLILNVAVRTNDLLVFTTSGLYSVVGILGSSVTIQLISPSLNIIDGMQDMALVNRTPYFLDNQATGQIDGRLHRMVGSTTEMVASITADDIAVANTPLLANNYQVARVATINNSAIVVQMKNGTSYVQTRSGAWVRLKYAVSPAPIYDKNQYAVAKYAVKNATIDQYPADEYFVAAYIDGTHAKRRLTFYRYIHNVYQAPYLDQNFAAPWTSGTVLATGTVRLSEYWHQRPFSVRQVIIEYKTSSNASVTATVEPTGCLDALASNISSLTSTGVAAGSQATSAYVTEQFLCDNASKGYGAKVSLSLQGCSVRRVILNCED